MCKYIERIVLKIKKECCRRGSILSKSVKVLNYKKLIKIKMKKKKAKLKQIANEKKIKVN
jgi:hypothetical protein